MAWTNAITTRNRRDTKSWLEGGENPELMEPQFFWHDGVGVSINHDYRGEWEWFEGYRKKWCHVSISLRASRWANIWTKLRILMTVVGEGGVDGRSGYSQAVQQSAGVKVFKTSDSTTCTISPDLCEIPSCWCAVFNHMSDTMKCYDVVISGLPGL